MYDRSGIFASKNICLIWPLLTNWSNFTVTSEIKFCSHFNISKAPKEPTNTARHISALVVTAENIMKPMLKACTFMNMEKFQHLFFPPSKMLTHVTAPKLIYTKILCFVAVVVVAVVVCRYFSCIVMYARAYFFFFFFKLIKFGWDLIIYLHHSKSASIRYT